jgi:hypothetical protein
VGHINCGGNMAIEGIMSEKRREMREEFLKLTPFQRMDKMNAVLDDIIAFKAKNKGVHEYEIYQGYLEASDKHNRRIRKNR